MTEQSNFSQLTDAEGENDTDETGTDDFPSPNRSDSAESRSTLTEHVDPTVESWVGERENRKENYGYFHLYVVTKSDLTGVERHLRYEEEIGLTVSEGDTSRHYSGRWGQGGVYVDEARNRLINWKLEELATPYHPEFRTVSAGNLHIFVAILLANSSANTTSRSMRSSEPSITSTSTDRRTTNSQHVRSIERRMSR